MDTDECIEKPSVVKVKADDQVSCLPPESFDAKECQFSSLETSSSYKNGTCTIEGDPTEIKIEFFGKIKPSMSQEYINLPINPSESFEEKSGQGHVTSLYCMDAIGDAFEIKTVSNPTSSSSVEKQTKEQNDELINEENALVDNNNSRKFKLESMTTCSEHPNQHKYEKHLMPRENQYSDQIEMPPLCSTRISTPILSIQFSPLLSFSEERGMTNNGFARQLVEVVSGEGGESKESYQDIKCECVDNIQSSISCSVDEVGLFMPSSWTPSDTKGSLSTTNQCHNSSNLTYADNLLLNASQGRQHITTSSSPSEWRQEAKSPKIRKKRKTPENQCRSNRQPQKRFSVGLDKSETPGGDLFVSKRDGRVRLTTNLPRAVEACDPETYTTVHLYASCSEAAREMGINRTRMSRSKFND